MSSEGADADKDHDLIIVMLNICVSMMNIIVSAPEMKGNEIDVHTRPADSNLKQNQIAMKSTQANFKLKRCITMDFVAGNIVMPQRVVIRKSEVRESEGSRNGVHYVAANDGRIPNEGDYDSISGRSRVMSNV